MSTNKRIVDFPAPAGGETPQADDQVLWWQTATGKTLKGAWSWLVDGVRAALFAPSNSGSSSTQTMHQAHIQEAIGNSSGTTQTQFGLDTNNQGPYWSHQSGEMQLRSAADNELFDLRVNNLFVDSRVHDTGKFVNVKTEDDHWGELGSITLVANGAYCDLILQVSSFFPYSARFYERKIAVRYKQNGAMGTVSPTLFAYALSTTGESEIPLRLIITQNDASAKVVKLFAKGLHSFSFTHATVVHNAGTPFEPYGGNIADVTGENNILSDAELPSGDALDVLSLTRLHVNWSASGTIITPSLDRLSVAGNLEVSGLSGTGTRSVTVDANGQLAAVPLLAPISVSLGQGSTLSKTNGSTATTDLALAGVATSNSAGFITHQAGTLTQISMSANVSAFTTAGDLEVRIYQNQNATPVATATLSLSASGHASGVVSASVALAQGDLLWADLHAPTSAAVFDVQNTLASLLIEY